MSDAGEYLTGPERWLLAGQSSPARLRSKLPPRAISYSTPSIHAVRRLLRSYDLESEVDGMLYHRGVSDTFFLSTPRRQFALKLYHTGWRSRAEVLEEVAAICHCGAQGVNVAMPIERRDGEFVSSMRAPEGTRWAILFPWASGRVPKYSNTDHARRFGQMIGQVHTAMSGFSQRSVRPVLDLDYLLHRPVEQIKLHLGRLPAVAKRLDALYQRIQSRLDRIGSELSEWGFCHGDVHVHNSRIDEDDLVLFDFDHCGQGWQLSDLATYRWQARIDGAEELAWESFLGGYLQVRPVAAQSLDHVDVFMMIKHLWNKAHLIRLWIRNGRILFIDDKFLEDTVAFCEQLESARTR